MKEILEKVKYLFYTIIILLSAGFVPTIVKDETDKIGFPNNISILLFWAMTIIEIYFILQIKPSWFYKHNKKR